MSHIKKGDCVKVDFISESATIYSGKRFTGYGVVDRFEDNRVFGRLEDGQPFMCFASDVEVLTERNQEVGDDSHGDYTQMTLEQLQKEHAELLAFNEKLDRERNKYRKDALKYAKKVQMIERLFVVPSDDHELTLKAIKTIVEQELNITNRDKEQSQ